ncbi:MAG: T9SS type A sorting domain-containing protein, partial [Bacteroidales bacterium]|nr:T9SS type A sorting domain-containing protein [Bacteroidales bacterium]
LYGDYKPAVVDGYTYPIEEFEVRFDPVPPHYPDTIWIITGTCEEPKALRASRQIDTKAIILDDGGLNCYAGSSIRLLPDFKAESGSCFKAKIDITMLQDIYYQATDINTCTGGSLSPAESIAERDMPNAFMPPLAFYTVDDSLTNIKAVNSNKLNFSIVDKPNNVYNDDKTSIKIFPNPSTGVFNINSEIAIESIIVQNQTGIIVLSIKRVNKTFFTIDLSNQPCGVYYLKAVNALYVNTVKIIKM